jgi:hypothetical protein
MVDFPNKTGRFDTDSDTGILAARRPDGHQKATKGRLPPLAP